MAGAEILWGHDVNDFGPTTPFGTLSLDLTGYHDAEPFGEVSQTIETEPGQRYRLSFSLGTYSVLWFGAVAVEAQAGDTTLILSGENWQRVAMDFSATGATTMVRIRGTTAQVNPFVPVYLGLDNVSVVPLNGFDEVAVGTPILASMTRPGVLSARSRARWRRRAGL